MTNILPQTTKKYPCAVCKMGFDKKKEYTEHLKTTFHTENLKLAAAFEKIHFRTEEEEKQKALKNTMVGEQTQENVINGANVPNASTTNETDHKFICEACDFSTNNKKDYTLHTKTTKHDINTSEASDTLTCACGKTYKHKSSLCNHKKKCKFLASQETNANLPTETTTETTTNSVNIYFHTGGPNSVDSDGEPYFDNNDDNNKTKSNTKSHSKMPNSETADTKTAGTESAPSRKYNVSEDGTPEQEAEREEVRQIVISVLRENKELQQLIMDYQELKYNLNRVLMCNENEAVNELLNEVVNQMMQKQLHRILSEQFKNDERFKNSKFCL